MTSPKKCTPPNFKPSSGKSMGFRQLKWLHLKEQNNQEDGTNKNVDISGSGCSRNPDRLDEKRKTRRRVG